MTDHDERVARRYRELGREEPAATLDDAILAASRRAVGSRPGNRWAGPVSIAAVLVLGIGVSLRMQMEKPGIETSVPASSPSAEYPVTPAAEDAAVKPVPAPGPAPKAAPATAPVTASVAAPATEPEVARDQARANKEAAAAQAPASAERRMAAAGEPAKRQDKLSSVQRSEPKVLADSAAPSSVYEEPAVLASQAPIPAAPPAVAAAATAARERPAPQERPVPQARMALPPASITSSVAGASAPPPPAAAAPMQASPDVTAMRAKRETQGAAASESTLARKADVAKDSREVELERIARLRAENRHEEADKALTEFRRINPDYRIPEAVWERVKAR